MSSPPFSDFHRVHICGNPSCAKIAAAAAAKFRACQRCQSIWYCSPTCATANWPQHQTGCNYGPDRRDLVQAMRDEETDMEQRAAALFAGAIVNVTMQCSMWLAEQAYGPGVLVVSIPTQKAMDALQATLVPGTHMTDVVESPLSHWALYYRKQDIEPFAGPLEPARRAVVAKTVDDRSQYSVVVAVANRVVGPTCPERDGWCTCVLFLPRPTFPTNCPPSRIMPFVPMPFNACTQKDAGQQLARADQTRVANMLTRVYQTKHHLTPKSLADANIICTATRGDADRCWTTARATLCMRAGVYVCVCFSDDL